METATIDLLLLDEALAATTNEDSPPTSGVATGSMTDVLLLASATDVFFTPTWEPLARRYADECGWSLAGTTAAASPYGDTTIASDVELLLEAVDCEGGLVARTDNTVEIGELSAAATERVESILELIGADLFTDGQPHG